MLAGKIVDWEKLELKAALSASHVGVDASASGSCISQWTPTTLLKVIGLSISILTNTDTGTSVIFDCPILRASPKIVIVSGSFEASTNAEIIFSDFKLYCKPGGIWYVTWSEVLYKVNGSTEETIAAGNYTQTGYFAPSSVPMMGIPPAIGCSAGAGDPDYGIPGSSCVTAAKVEATCSATCVGGWRFKEGGSYFTPAVTANLANPPGISCPPDAPAFSLPSGSNTYDLTATGYAQVSTENRFTGADAGRITCPCPPGCEGISLVADVWQGENKSQMISGSILGMPSLAKSVKRWNSTPEYRALWYRGGTPKTEKRAFSACGDDPESPPDSTVESVVTVHAEQSEMLSTVGNADHVIEDVLDFVSYTPAYFDAWSFLARSTCSQTVTPGSCRLIGLPDPCPDGQICWNIYNDANAEIHGSHFPYTVQDTVANPDILGYLEHADDVARYVNTICNGHWCYFYWFPYNTTADEDGDGEPDKQGQWKVFGADIQCEYWTKLRHQWLEQALLPDSEDLQTRAHLLSMCGYENGLMSFIREYALPDAPGASWLGVHRFKAETPAPPSSKALTSTSEDGWSFVDCTAVFGATITLTPTAGTLIKARYDLGRFDCGAFMYPHLCKSIQVAWPGTNIASVNVNLISISGESVLLATAAGTHVRPPTATDGAYAGSHRHEFGAGYIEDQGSNIASGALDLMGSPEAVQALQLLAGQGAATLEFEITVTSAAAPCDINYPTFHVQAENASFYNESAHHQAFVFADGPGLRFGALKWYDGASLLETPEATDPGSDPDGHKTTVLDYMCTRNVLHLGVAHDTGLTAEIAALYDAVEGQDYEHVAEHTIAFLVPGGKAGRGIMVNTLREPPPLAMFPYKSRNTTTYEATGAHAQESWSYATDVRYYISSDTSLTLVEPPSTIISSAIAGEPAGWVVTEHEYAVDNNEDYFQLWHSGEIFARIRPWHGGTLIGERGEASGDGPPSYDVGPGMDHYRAYVDGDGDLVLGRSPNAPVSWTDEDSGIDADWGRIVQARTRKDAYLYVLYLETGGSLKLAKTVSIDEPPSAVATIGAFTQGDLLWVWGGEVYVYYVDAGTIKAKVYDSQLTLVRSITTDITGVDNATIRAQAVVTTQGLLKFALMYSIGGVVTVEHSSDGSVFTGAFSLATSTHADICWTRDGRLWGYYYDAGDIKGKAYDLQLGAVLSFTTNIDDADDAGFDVMESVKGQGKWRMGILYLSSGVLLSKHAVDDGQNFS